MANMLIRGTVGGAYAEANVGRSLADWGWLAGAGIDYMVGSNVSVGGELLYHRFDDFDGAGSDIKATTPVARMSYHF